MLLMFHIQDKTGSGAPFLLGQECICKPFQLQPPHVHVWTHSCTKAGFMRAGGAWCGRLKQCRIVTRASRVRSLQERTTLPPCWVCAARWPLCRAPSLWRAWSPASVWWTSVPNPAPRSPPARRSDPQPVRLVMLLWPRPSTWPNPCSRHVLIAVTQKTGTLWIFAHETPLRS